MSDPRRKRSRGVAVNLTLFGLMADVACFTQFMGVWLIRDDQPLVGSVYLLLGTATVLYLATFGWASIQKVMRREGETRG